MSNSWLNRLFGIRRQPEAPQEPTPRQRRENLEEELKLKRLERAKRLMESYGDQDYWLTAYTDLLARYRDGGTLAYPISQPTDRRYGQNFPFWFSEQQLSLIRAQARLLTTTNCNAQGLLNGLTSYVIGTGYTYKALPTERAADTLPDAIVGKTQRIIDEFCEQNAWAEMEQELFVRSREDGEFFLRLFPQTNGRMMVRTVEPEQIFQPPGTTLAEWSYGIQTDPDDVFNIKAYYVHYLAPGGEGDEDRGSTLGEEVPADEMVHLKCNVKRGIKRGLSDFSYDTLDSFNTAGKLRTNMGEGAAVQAAIAGIRQHEAASSAQVESFVQSQIEYTTYNPTTARETDYQTLKSGSFLDIPHGMNYVPPPGASNASAHLEVFQGLLRSAGNRHNAPEWLVSSNASNNNYASSLTAESPFLRNCVRLQKFYERAFVRVIREAVQTAAQAGRLPSNILKLIEIKVTAPSVETRDKMQEAQANQIYNSMGIKSAPTIAAELGLDWQEEAAHTTEFQQEMAAAGPLPMGAPGAPGDDGPDDGTDGPQSFESVDPDGNGPAPEAEPEKPQQLPEAEKKYAHIDFTPPQGAREAAKRALSTRRKAPASQRGMTAVGIARARDLARGATMSPETVRRMKSFFDRHIGDKKGSTWDSKGKGWQAWQGWGGDPGYAWARKIVRQMEAADNETSESVITAEWLLTESKVGAKIRRLRQEGKPQAQAVAIALDMARRGDIAERAPTDGEKWNAARSAAVERVGAWNARARALAHAIYKRRGGEYGADNYTEGRWITIGAQAKAPHNREEGDEGTKRGGVAVYIDDDGTISKGPAHMTGKKPNELKRQQRIGAEPIPAQGTIFGPHTEPPKSFTQAKAPEPVQAPKAPEPEPEPKAPEAAPEPEAPAKKKRAKPTTPADKKLMKDAEEAGLDPAGVLDHAREQYRDAMEKHDLKMKMRAEVRRLFQSFTGKRMPSPRWKGWDKGEWASIPGYDQIEASLSQSGSEYVMGGLLTDAGEYGTDDRKKAASYVQGQGYVGGETGDNGQRILDIINPRSRLKPPSKEEIYKKALEDAHEMPGMRASDAQPEDPFGGFIPGDDEYAGRDWADEEGDATEAPAATTSASAPDPWDMPEPAKAPAKRSPDEQPAEKPNHHMTAKEFFNRELNAMDEEERRIVANDEEVKQDYFDKAKRDWKRNLERKAKNGRLPDDVLDDYVNQYGLDDLRATFRGQLEKGALGYVPKNIRDEKVDRPKEDDHPVVKLAQGKAHEMAWDERRKAGNLDWSNKAEPRPDDNTPKYWRELKKQHAEEIRNALYDGRNVPAEVLADYPQLQAKQAQPEAPEKSPEAPAAAKSKQDHEKTLDEYMPQKTKVDAAFENMLKLKGIEQIAPNQYLVRGKAGNAFRLKVKKILGIPANQYTSDPRTDYFELKDAPSYISKDTSSYIILDRRDRVKEIAKNAHEKAIVSAIDQGKAIPPEVLADYPELQAKQADVLKELEPKAPAAKPVEAPKQAQPEAPAPAAAPVAEELPKLIPYHQEIYDALEPAMTKALGKETAAHRQASVALSMMQGEPPAVRAALADRLKAVAPEAHEYLRKQNKLPEPEKKYEITPTNPTTSIKNVGRSKSGQPIKFETPITGPSGAKLNAYDWQWKEGEKYSHREDGMVSAKVSDWDKSETSSETGKQVVHQFSVTDANGENHLVSLEGAARMLGFSPEKTKEFKNVAGAVKTLAKNQMVHAAMRQELDYLSKIKGEAEKQISGEPMPKPIVSPDPTSPNRFTIKIGDYEQKKYSKGEPTADEIEQIKSFYKDHRIEQIMKSKVPADMTAHDFKNRINSLGAQIQDLEGKIKTQKKRVNELSSGFGKGGPAQAN